MSDAESPDSVDLDQTSQELTSGPDLVQTAVSDPLPATMVVGDTFPITDTVTNNGTSASGASTTQYYLAHNNSYPFSMAYRSKQSRSVPALNPGELNDGGATLKIEVNLPEGTYWIVACADYGKVVAETSESNNCRASANPVAITGADLQASGVMMSPSSITASPGATLNVTETVANLGSLAADTTTTRYFFSDDAVRGNDGYVRNCVNGGPIPGRSVPALGGKTSGSNTNTDTAILGPLCVRDASGLHPVLPGQYYVIACADDAQVVGETDENNNCSISTASFTVTVTCGNNVLETGEACDDGNTGNGDSCNATCTGSLSTIDITPDAPSIPKGTTVSFSANGSYSDGSKQNLTTNVTWVSADTTVASITTSGVASALTIGTSSISATLGSVSDATLLSVVAPTITGISITPQDQSIARLTKQQYEALAIYSDATTVDVTTSTAWSSSTAIASINASTGLATAGNTAGTTVISALYNGFTDSATLTVSNASVTSIALTPNTTTLLSRGSQLQFTAVATFNDSGTISTQDITNAATWFSSRTTVATIASTGLVTATSVNSGDSNITATLSGVTSPITIVRVVNATLESIAITPANQSVAIGFSVQLTATGTYKTGSTFFTVDLTKRATWSTSPTGIATVTNTGFVKVVAAGSTTVSAVFGGVTGTTSLNGTNATLSSITIAPSPVTLAAKATQQLTATGHFTDGSTLDITKQVSWTSSDKQVVTVNANGRVKGTKVGTATITAKKDFITATDSVTVN